MWDGSFFSITQVQIERMHVDEDLVSKRQRRDTLQLSLESLWSEIYI